MKSNILQITHNLDNWFVKNKYKGIDPYDLYDIRFFHFLLEQKPVIRKINRKLITLFIKLFPSFIVRLFKIKPNINAKSLGLIIKGYCNLYDYTGDVAWLNKAENLAEILLQNPNKDYIGMSWGYPFNWSSKKFVPKNTPSSVVTTIVGDGLFALFEKTGKWVYLQACGDICTFLTCSLNLDEIDENKVCFSYTPIDNNHVHNANLFTAEFLLRIGKKLDNDSYIQLAKRALNYAVSELREDGSLPYWGMKDKRYMKLVLADNDHYHTGFELRCMERMQETLQLPGLSAAIRKYYLYYLRHYVSDNFIYLRPDMKYPVNIHGCAEFMILNAQFIKYDYGIEKDKYLCIADNIIERMLDKKDGLFIYDITNAGLFEMKSKFKYFRWSQAWMFLGLTEVLKMVND